MPDDKAVEATRGMSLVDAAARLQALYSPQQEDTARRSQPASLPPDVRMVDPEVLSDTPTDDEEPAGEEAQEAAQPPAEDDDVDPEDAPPPPKKYRVRANGTDLEVTEDELLKGYSRSVDYARQKTRVSELEKTAKTETEQARTERAKLAQDLAEVDQALKALKPAEPNWEQLRATDPTQYAIAVADWNLYQRKAQEVSEAKRDADAKVYADRMKEGQEFLARERESLIEKVPTWKDGKTANKELAAMVDYAKSHGYTDAELAGIADHRVLMMLRDAWQYDASRKAKPVAQQLAEQKIAQVKAVTPGQPAPPMRRGEKATKALVDKVLRPGGANLKDSAALFEKLYGAGNK